jgi:hypothetical protein
LFRRVSEHRRLRIHTFCELTRLNTWG